MFSFLLDSPEQMHPQFLAAFQNAEYKGFDLSWLELEILQSAVVETPIPEIFEKMKKEYGKDAVGHRSNFYRKIDSLVTKGYLADPSKYDESISTRTITTIDKGHLELGRHSRYFLEKQIKEIFPQLLFDIINKSSKYVGNVLEQKLCVVSADYNNLSNFEVFTRQVIAKYFNITDLRDLKGDYYYINFDGSTVPDLHGISVLNSKLEDWPLKSDYIDTCLMYNAISTFPEKDILAEPIRVLRSGGFLVISEIADMGSSLATSLFQSISMVANLIMENTSWKIPGELKNVDQIVEIINRYEDLEWVGEPIRDIPNTTFILRKK